MARLVLDTLRESRNTGPLIVKKIRHEKLVVPASTHTHTQATLLKSVGHVQL